MASWDIKIIYKHFCCRSFSSTACLGLTYYSVFLPSEMSIQLCFSLCAGAEIVAIVLAAMTLQCLGRRCSTFLFGALSGMVCLLQAFSSNYVGKLTLDQNSHAFNFYEIRGFVNDQSQSNKHRPKIIKVEQKRQTF
ncbi:uncharacterized protein TNCT_260221 [Trichonephila clavata]|uniref:Uncharacterized protein n=1 Tax=Trichonephila clavata TaxID=2740835 RepID=A0A8X6IHJ7_TRICU|nr:uncharacterized protein TNCT_260221 [Trichonephila clavata]